MKCELCSTPALGQVWGHQVCADHHGDWHKAAPNEGAVDAKYGHPATLAEQTESYTKFTEGWLAKRQLEQFHSKAQKAAT